MSFTQNEEFLEAIGNTVEQGLVSFADGFQLAKDAPDFFDELFTDWPRAIRDLAKNFAEELANVQPEEIDAAVNAQTEKWVRAGMDPAVAYLIGSGLKTVYAGLALGARKKRENLVLRG